MNFVYDYEDSPATTKYPEFMFEFWLRRSLKINNAGNVFPVVGLVDIWDDHNGKSTVEDAWRKTTGKKFEAMFPIGDIFSVSLSHYIRSSGNDKEHYRALYPSDVVNGHKIHTWDNHINIAAHQILAQLLSQKISDIMLRVCSNNYNDKCNDEEALYKSYTSMLNKLKVPSSEDVEGKSLPLLRKYNVFEKLATSDQIVSTVLKSWQPKYGSTNDIVMCHAKKVLKAMSGNAMLTLIRSTCSMVPRQLKAGTINLLRWILLVQFWREGYDTVQGNELQCFFIVYSNRIRQCAVWERCYNFSVV